MRSEINARLKTARQSAGHETLAAAAEALGVKESTYTHHENGTRGISVQDLAFYAAKFGVDPCYIAFGTDTQSVQIHDLSESDLHQIVVWTLSHTRAPSLSPEDLADKIIAVCRHVGQSDISGAEKVVDFALAQHERRRG